MHHTQIGLKINPSLKRCHSMGQTLPFAVPSFLSAAEGLCRKSFACLNPTFDPETFEAIGKSVFRYEILPNVCIDFCSIILKVYYT
jgi:hypothetical protein